MLNIHKLFQGIFLLLWIALTTLFISIFVLLFYGLSQILPHTLQSKITTLLSKSPYYWATLNKPAIHWLGAKQWKVSYPKELDPHGIYLVISNHQSWADIIIILFLLERKIAPLKFFMKKELAWQLPIIGLACKAIGFPMLSRHTKEAIKKNPELKNKDRESMINACASVKKNPSSLIIFPEGSRLTRLKQAKQDSPYPYLLKPKAGGVAMIVNGVKDNLQGILDITIDFRAKNSKISLWNFVMGDYTSLHADIEFLPIPDKLQGNYEEDKEYRKIIQSWLSERWNLKNQNLTKGRSNAQS
jgi:1-acyl-sn-glycerol-3-phosphate acyltransferase